MKSLYQTLMDMMTSTPINQSQRFGDITGKFLPASKAPGYFNQTFNDPYLYYHGYKRVPFQSDDGDIRLVAPELPPVNVLNSPRKYNVQNNIRDIAGGNNRSGFDPSLFDSIQDIAGTTAPFSPTNGLTRKIIHGLRRQNNQGFIKTPPIGANQYPVNPMF